MVQGARRPDLTILLDAPVAKALARAHARNAGAAPDRFEEQRSDFFERVRRTYRLRADLEPKRFAIIDADRTADEVTANILFSLEALSWIS